MGNCFRGQAAEASIEEVTVGKTAVFIRPAPIQLGSHTPAAAAVKPAEAPMQHGIAIRKFSAPPIIAPELGARLAQLNAAPPKLDEVLDVDEFLKKDRMVDLHTCFKEGNANPGPPKIKKQQSAPLLKCPAIADLSAEIELEQVTFEHFEPKEVNSDEDEPEYKPQEAETKEENLDEAAIWSFPSSNIT